jgi:hypothetical protein
LPEQTQGIGAAVFPDFEVVAVGGRQVFLVGQQVHAQQVGGRGGKFEPDIEQPDSAVGYVALHGEP